MTNQSLYEQALALPIDERIGLADALWESISRDLPVSEPQDALQQALARAAEVENGTAILRSHDEVMQAARRAIGCD